MINQTVLNKLEQVAVEHKQRVEARRRLNELADKVLHVPHAPVQRIYEDTDPRKRKLKKIECATAEEEKLRQFANTAAEVDEDNAIEMHRRVLLGDHHHHHQRDEGKSGISGGGHHHHLEVEKNGKDLLCLNLLQRPHSARSSMTDDKQKSQLHQQRMTPRMRPGSAKLESNTNNSESDALRIQKQQQAHQLQVKRSLILQSQNSQQQKQQQQQQLLTASSPSLGERTSSLRRISSKGKSAAGVSFAPSQQNQQQETDERKNNKDVRKSSSNNFNSSSPRPTKPDEQQKQQTRGRLFSMIDVVDCDFEEDDDDHQASYHDYASGNSASALFSSSSLAHQDDDENDDGGGACEFQFYERQVSSATLKKQANHRQESQQTRGASQQQFLELDTMKLETPITPPILDFNITTREPSALRIPIRIALGRSSNALNQQHQQQQQRSESFLGASQISSSPSSPLSRAQSRAMLTQQRKSIVSGIWGKFTQQQQQQNRQKFKVNVEGDIRLRVIEQQWISPNRKLPRNYKNQSSKDRSTNLQRAEDEMEASFMNRQKRERLAEKLKMKKTGADGHNNNNNNGDDDIRLQCVIEYEKEMAKDRRELAVTFTERFLKVKDGSCRPLKSKFVETAKREEDFLNGTSYYYHHSSAEETCATAKMTQNANEKKRRKGENYNDDDDDVEEDRDSNDSFMNEEPVPFELDDMKQTSSSNTIQNSEEQNKNHFMFLTGKRQQKAAMQTSLSSTTATTVPHHKSNRLPRSSWHVDFAVQDSERETWKWFTRKIYRQANAFTSGGGGTESNDKNHNNSRIIVQKRKIFGADDEQQHHERQDMMNNSSFHEDDDQNKEKIVYLSSTMLKNVTISGCVKGFNSKKFKIPDPPTLEEILYEREIEEQKMSDANDNTNSASAFPFTSSPSPVSPRSSHRLVMDNNHTPTTLTPALSRTASLSQAALKRATSDLPASLMKAESFRQSPSSSMNFNNNNNNKNSNQKQQKRVVSSVSASLAKFRSRKYFESAAKLREQEAEQEAREEEERLRRVIEEERKRKKAILLDSLTFLQCSLDNSAKFFRRLAKDERLLLKAINLEHCKLPRNKTEGDHDDDDDDDTNSNISSKDSASDAKSTSSAKNSLKTVSPSSTAKSTTFSIITPPTALIATSRRDGRIHTSLVQHTTNNSLNSSMTETPQAKKITTNIRIVSPRARSLMMLGSGENNGGSNSMMSSRPLVLTTPRERALQVKRQREMESSGDTGNLTPQILKRRDTLPPSSSREQQNPKQNDDTAVSLKVAFLEGDEVADDFEEKSRAKKSNKTNHSKDDSSSGSSSSSDDDDDDDESKSPFSWAAPSDVEEDFAEAFLDHFVASQASTLTSLSLHGTRFTETFLEKLCELIRSSDTLIRLQHLDIGLCGIEAMDETPYCSKVMASAIAHAPPSLRSLSLSGTALSPHFVGISFSAAVRANVNLVHVDCVGCDRGGTRFEILIQKMLDERKQILERRRIKVEMKKQRSMKRLQNMMRMGGKKSQQQQLEEEGEDTTYSTSSEDDDQQFSLVPSKSVALIDNEELF